MNYNDEILSHYGIKTAGGTGWPLGKNWTVDAKRIKKVCKDSREFTKEFLDSMDWGKIKWEKPKPNPYRTTGTLTFWYVYPKGQYNEGDYIYGYVMTEWLVGHNGVEIQGDVVVKH